MPRYFWMAVSQVGAGLLLVLLPDKDEPIISINTSHGPSTFDLIGLVLIASGWVWLTIFLIARWRSMSISLGTSKLYLLLSTYVLGISLVIYGLRVESEVLLWSGVTLSSLSNLLLILAAVKVNKYS